MRYKKNKFIFFFVFLIALFAYGKSTQVMAADKINIYLFWAKGCPHCYVEKQFLENLQKRDNQVNIVCLEITESKENRELFTKVGKLLRAEIAGLPFTVVGNLYLVGWQDDQTSGRALEKLLKKVRQESLPDMVGPLMPPPTTCPPEGKRAIPEKITLPLIGEI
jgi:thiol-disulfide isomerase/thioredoxin